MAVPLFAHDQNCTHFTMSLIKKLAGQTALYGLSSILGRLLTFVFLTPFLTYVFNEDRTQMGIQTDVYAWAAFLMVLFTYRIETAFFRFGVKKEQRATAYKTATRAMACTTLLGVGLLVALAQPIAQALGYPDKALYIYWFAFILGFDALVALPFALLRLQGRALKFAAVKLLNLLLHLGGVLTFLYVLPRYAPSRYDPTMGIGYVFLANLIASAATFVVLLPDYYKTVHRAASAEQALFDPALLKRMLWYALPLVVAGFAGIVNEVLDRILLKIYLPGSQESVLEQLGVYGACYKIAIFMNLFTQAFNYAAEPFFFKNVDKAFAKQLYANIALLFTLVGCLGFLGILLFMDVVQYFVAPNYREGLVIVPMLLLANLCLGLYYNVAVWYKLSDKTRYGAMIALGGAGITILANMVLIPWFIQAGQAGYLGSAWATLACYTSMVALAYGLGQKHYPIPYPVGRMLSYIGLAVLIYLGYNYWLRPMWSAVSWKTYALSASLLMLYGTIISLVDGRQLLAIIRQTPPNDQ
jgi:O-antigen/teichoic acid export membrane protein